MADSIVVLREGTVEQMGTPIELYARPRNQFVAGFLGTPQMNMLRAKVRTAGADGMSLSIDDEKSVIQATVDGMGSVVDADCTVGIRPEHMALSDRGEIVGSVVATEMLGAETIVFANLHSGESIIASVRGIRSLQPGALVRFSADRRFVHVFDAHGLSLPPLRSWREDYLDDSPIPSVGSEVGSEG
jgi:ABC-type sugar transport system ATPase subunit